MHNLNKEEVHQVSGGGLTSDIINYFRNLNTDSETGKQEWQSVVTTPSPALQKGDQYGAAIVTGLAAIALFSVRVVGGALSGIFR
ncbi:hypothetical protein K7R23_24525 [Citrobacter rodentium NBRC 105723 = DSM 16636]|jgi:hypothetical protein|nr:hypothetical protein [Citrobacter rodentium]KIQ52712.1 hypothetical protein TA05_02985 [Citrobacter rodentium]QBY31598.1 hypothetical protein E2R62_24115 [Citrobacter rodentium]UHO31043.1 hypothetical protein K7R23_24525 [Citrobacter rodentium NBRC 105723 = DSM 16636]HAT8013592.1 hypothetical protein [Citrobacter rodentium NBRC 105723 = DSM 16636]HAT8018161.1 hypothetical protein [Citrobacter rodentium]